ncbi:MarR family winged helix-turn-helix transcriptional regulator [Frigidibacter sp. ROC022]|uniref:MarR family winged helix-turn-helix transcriptional regulator n=1 Tax=Frigidibacter sp. ROC022 TaxID=2971796 RepID=UPI00215A997C|nr:MarR family transcriptional regulator [Frigidibacter sp. ROC022]MCR8725208.1 MarR family transcriptional regulator [Frigidibacter sp. ROC022]
MSKGWKYGDPVPFMHDRVAETLRAEGLADAAIPALLDFDTANFQWHRVVARGEIMQSILNRLKVDLDLSLYQGLLALIRIQAGVGREAAQPTIGLVAEEMAVDPSRASRIVSELVNRGYVRREVAQDDGRRSVLSLTPRGFELLGRFRAEKWQIMARVFRDWEPESVAHFARSIRAYTESVQAVMAERAAEPAPEPPDCGSD